MVKNCGLAYQSFIFSFSSVHYKSCWQVLTLVANSRHLVRLSYFNKTRLDAFHLKCNKGNYSNGFLPEREKRECAWPGFIAISYQWWSLLSTRCKLTMLSIDVWCCWVNQFHYHKFNSYKNKPCITMNTGQLQILILIIIKQNLQNYGHLRHCPDRTNGNLWKVVGSFYLHDIKTFI